MTVAVSVVIPHYGAADQTIDLLNDLAGQQDAGSLEVIVADDASPDPFPLAVATAYNARLVRRESNGGFGSACNSGAEVACGDSLLFLNSDTRVGPRFIAELVASSMPFQPAVTGPAVMGHGEVVATGRRWVSARHYAAEWSIPFRKLRAAKGLPLDTARVNAAVPGQVVPVDWLFGVALLIPTEAFRRVGGFDERFFMNCEEMDLQRRLAAVGVPSVFIGTVSIEHSGGGSSDPRRQVEWLTDARLRYADKWGFGRQLRLLLTAAALGNAGFHGVRAALGRPTSIRAQWHRDVDLIWKRTPRSSKGPS
jgi:N-acetylglucosaminyl-diphospho-decaprenol L-rhamnosyltransferase